MVMSKQKDRRRAGMVGLVIAAACVLAAPTAAVAVYTAISFPATLSSGSGRTITAEWGYAGPHTGAYRANFQCGLSGCANFVSSSTYTQSLSRYVSLATCTGYQANHTLWARDMYGGENNSSSYTRWTAGSFCR